MKTIKINSEFASEIVCAVPYAYWLHTQGKLEKVITTKGMTPFYYFCDDVSEEIEKRTVNNEVSGLNDLPNNWIHGTRPKEEPGVLDYSEWMPPPYIEKYKTKDFDTLKPFVVINNNYNREFGRDISESLRYFDVKTLYELFNYLTEIGYSVVYKRPDNTEFSLDENEIHTLANNHTLSADVEGIGIITDYELTEYYDNVHLIDTIVYNSEESYNETQLKLFSSAEGFITTNGGGAMLCGYFKKPVIVYVPDGKELRKNYLDNDNSYFRKLSGCDVYPVLDPGPNNDYSKVINKVKEVFDEKN
tara:strand:- start:664 stop:1572 length:909 start_codon:yes stop_codon:yes gene_type:complete